MKAWERKDGAGGGGEKRESGTYDRQTAGAADSRTWVSYQIR